MQYTLAGTLDQILQLCNPLDASVAEKRRPHADWTISEIIEHLAIVERGAVVGLKRTLSQAPATAEAIEAAHGKSEVISKLVGTVVNRIEAPEVAQPSNKFGPWPAPLIQFQETRQKLLELESGDSSGFDTHLMGHPILGPMTVRQWFQFVAAHTNRHLKQIEGLLASG